jgi:hypothetical protein
MLGSANSRGVLPSARHTLAESSPTAVEDKPKKKVNIINFFITYPQVKILLFGLTRGNLKNSFSQKYKIQHYRLFKGYNQYEAVDNIYEQVLQVKEKLINFIGKRVNKKAFSYAILKGRGIGKNRIL